MDNANKPAFPYLGTVVENTNPGLTKREYFAALLMQGMLANGHAGSFGVVSNNAVDGADELLKRLEENKISQQ